MQKCPICGVLDDHYVVTTLADESTGLQFQIDTCYCAQCDHDWEIESERSAATDPIGCGGGQLMMLGNT